MKTFKKDWKLGAAVGTALSLGSAGAIAGPHGFDLHNVLNGASASSLVHQLLTLKIQYPLCLVTLQH
jgi:hypothetical protein